MLGPCLRRGLEIVEYSRSRKVSKLNSFELIDIYLLNTFTFLKLVF